MKCPCCGQAVEGALPAEGLAEVRVSPMSRRILTTLIDAYPRPVSTDDMLFAIYNGCGEPEWAEGCLKVRISGLRKVLPAYGWTIPRNGGGSGNSGRYRLERVS